MGMRLASRVGDGFGFDARDRRRYPTLESRFERSADLACLCYVINASRLRLSDSARRSGEQGGR